MIRMGRGNRTDQPGSNDFQEPAAPEPYRYATDAQPAATRAISESDSMARDIKEGRLSDLAFPALDALALFIRLIPYHR